MAEDNGNKLGPKSNFIAEVYANMETKKIVDKVTKVIKKFGNKPKEKPGKKYGIHDLLKGDEYIPPKP